MINTLDRTKVAMSLAPQFALFAAIGCLTACGTTADNANSVYETATITFDKYHTVVEFDGYLEGIIREHDDLANLVEIGRSRAGRRIHAVEIYNPATVPAD